MGNQATSTVILILDAVVALFSYFVVAPMIMNAVAQFGVHKRFAQTMVDEGVISAEDVKMIQPKKQIAGVVISAILLITLGITCYKIAPFGYLCAGLPLLVGFWKYAKVTQFNSLTVQRFQVTYKGKYNEAKLNQYINRMF